MISLLYFLYLTALVAGCNKTFLFILIADSVRINMFGKVSFNDYTTSIMIENGYILVKPLLKQFKKKNQDTKINNVNEWERRNKKYIKKCQLNAPLFITINEGPKSERGIYFHRDIVLDVIRWCCPLFLEQNNKLVINLVHEDNEKVINYFADLKDEIDPIEFADDY
jgi:hypothetical protein